MEFFIAIDPGTEKCGIALMKPDGFVALHEIVETGSLAARVSSLAAENPGARTIAIGAGTGSAKIIAALRAVISPDIKIEKVREHNTTMLARTKYFKDNPPRGLLRLLPAGLRVPPRPVDDYAAVIIGEIFIKGNGE